MKRQGLHITVSGSVQGVGYRYYCREEAARRGLTGFVMNMPDGNVELEVFGAADLIDDFIMDITRKDRSYIVREIKKYTIPDNESYSDFSIAQYPGY